MNKNHFLGTLIFAGSLLLQLSYFSFHSRGAAGDVDLSFDPGSGVNGHVSAIAVQPDGKVMVGGTFTAVNGLLRPGIARLNSDGSGDSSFDPTPNVNGALSIAFQSDGQILVGNGNGISCLSSNGSLDTNFNVSIGPLNEFTSVDSIAVQPDGKILICGEFNAVNGANRVRIARLNANGTLDNAFDAGPGWDQRVASVVLQADGKILVGGEFSAAHGTNWFFGIARLNTDGSLDSSFTPNNGAYGVRSIALQPDGKIIIGGYFTSVNGASRIGIARLNSTGSLDASFDAGPGAPGVNEVALQSDGKVLIGGEFTTINGTNRHHVARLNANGGLDTSLDPGTRADNGVYTLGLQVDGKLLVGGAFGIVNGTLRDSIVRLNNNGGLDDSFDPGATLDNSISSVVVQPDGKALIGGVFTFINGTNRYGSARLNADGSRDHTFIADTNFQPDFGFTWQYPHRRRLHFSQRPNASVCRAPLRRFRFRCPFIEHHEIERICDCLVAGTRDRLLTSGKHKYLVGKFMDSCGAIACYQCRSNLRYAS